MGAFRKRVLSDIREVNHGEGKEGKKEIRRRR